MGLSFRSGVSCAGSVYPLAAICWVDLCAETAKLWRACILDFEGLSICSAGLLWFSRDFCKYFIYLGCHYEIVFRQAAYVVGRKTDSHIAIGYENVWVVPFSFCQLRHFIDEAHRLDEVVEPETSLDLCCVLWLPFGHHG